MSEAYRLSAVCHGGIKRVILETGNSIRDLYKIRGFKNNKSISVYENSGLFNSLLGSKDVKELKDINNLILIETNSKLAFDIKLCITKIDSIIINQHGLIDYPYKFYAVDDVIFIRFLKGKNVIDVSSDYIIFSDNKETGDLVDKVLKGVFYKEGLLESIINEKVCETVIGSCNDKTKILTYDSATRLVNDNVNTIMPEDNVNTVILEDNTKTVFPEDNTKTVMPESDAKTMMPIKTEILRPVKTKILQSNDDIDVELLNALNSLNVKSNTKEKERSD